MELTKRFWSKVIKGVDCWKWDAARLTDGYGSFSIKGKTQRAHRVAWELANGEIPGGVHVLHRCDNPSCVNPTHLFLGTNRDNIVDSISKGRTNRGTKNGGHKLSEAQVREIRSSSDTLHSLANRYGISIGHAYDIRKRLKWAWLP